MKKKKNTELLDTEGLEGPESFSAETAALSPPPPVPERRCGEVAGPEDTAPLTVAVLCCPLPWALISRLDAGLLSSFWAQEN